MKKIFFFLLVISVQTFGQKLKKADRIIIRDLENTVKFLADDRLEGRRTGTPGEKLAYEYLSDRLQKEGIQPKGENGTYLQTFPVKEGKTIFETTSLSINGKDLKLNSEFYPLSFSRTGRVSGTCSPSIREPDVPWFVDLREILSANADNPHFDIVPALHKKADELKQKGATALILLNLSNYDGIAFDKSYEGEAAALPVVVINKEAAEKYLDNPILDYELTLNVDIGEKERTGTNVIGYIDNGASNTVVLGAHYDHLGWGEDKNSLSTGKPQIHNGADDNASGVAAVLELGKLLKKSKLTNQNYLLVFFSGEELGLFGSKYFTQHPTVPLSSISYMINLDMVGRLNAANTITVGGYGTSPAWGNILPAKTKTLNVTFDSSGIGPSDHTSFYLQNIPVLFFFTGTHADYHKPTDDFDKINYTGQLFIIKYILDVLEKTNKESKPAFSKTREPQMSGTKFSVSLGIMPDYTFTGKGVHADGIIDDKAAQKAGILTGDVIIKIGEYDTPNLEEYMKALSRYKKGDATKVSVLRGSDQLEFDIVF